MGERKYPVLREGDQLQVEIGLHPVAHMQQRLHREQAVVADIDMRAHREQSLGDREVAVAKSALDHRLLGEQGLELAPERDAFEQRAGLVEARETERERGVHVEMRIDEGRGDEVAIRVQHLPGLGVNGGFDARDPPVGDGDVLPGPSVRQAGVADEEVDRHRVPFPAGGMGPSVATGRSSKAYAIASSAATACWKQASGGTDKPHPDHADARRAMAHDDVDHRQRSAADHRPRIDADRDALVAERRHPVDRVLAERYRDGVGGVAGGVGGGGTDHRLQRWGGRQDAGPETRAFAQKAVAAGGGDVLRAGGRAQHAARPVDRRGEPAVAEPAELDAAARAVGRDGGHHRATRNGGRRAQHELGGRQRDADEELRIALQELQDAAMFARIRVDCEQPARDLDRQHAGRPPRSGCAARPRAGAPRR